MASDVRHTSPAQRDQRDARPERIAARQYGVVAAGQLLDAGMSGSAIHRHARGGRLIRMYRGVYAVGHDRLTPQGHWMAAVLAGGPGAVLSHRSAAAAWGLRPDHRAVIDITGLGRRGARQAGLIAHRGRVHADDVTVLDGIPITTVARTLLDVAEVVPYRHALRAASRADELHLFDLRAIHATLDRAHGRRGAKPLRAVLDELADRPAGTRSELEARALDLIREHSLPKPTVNTLVEGHEVDLLWHGHRVVVELDGWSHHRARGAFEQDRRRDADLQAAGYRVVRFTWRQVTEDPAWVAGRLGELLATAGAGRRS